ncbi:hypothetical protein RDI58_008435 [Solanum bulbocastanum]|uniref:Uncharacterized protein n=1 Tax=Solanum bulbocastanum TaxID=147425 RepID=A0AAN8YJT9_SOLBU
MKVPQARSQRIHQSCYSYCNRLCCDGICRIFRQIDLHSYQQHHRWCFLIGRVKEKLNGDIEGGNDDSPHNLV